jgi:hypothetical protein
MSNVPDQDGERHQEHEDTRHHQVRELRVFRIEPTPIRNKDRHDYRRDEKHKGPVHRQLHGLCRVSVYESRAGFQRGHGYRCLARHPHTAPGFCNAQCYRFSGCWPVLMIVAGVERIRRPDLIVILITNLLETFRHSSASDAGMVSGRQSGIQP